jgi:hypothetical protein
MDSVVIEPGMVDLALLRIKEFLMALEAVGRRRTARRVRRQRDGGNDPRESRGRRGSACEGAPCEAAPCEGGRQCATFRRSVSSANSPGAGEAQGTPPGDAQVH